MIDLHGFLPLLAGGAVVTVKLALTSLFFGMLLGLLGATAKLSNIWVLRKIGTVYTTFFRSIPDLLLVLFMYYGLTILLNALLSNMGLDHVINISPFVAGVLTLSLTFGAYATETLRMAIQEIPVGQREAAKAIGLNSVQTFFRITLPQIWKLALPGLGNLFLVMLKDTALVSVVGLNELLRQATVAKDSTQEPFTFFFVAAIMYLLMTMVATVVLTWLQYISDPAARYKADSHISRT